MPAKFDLSFLGPPAQPKASALPEVIEPKAREPDLSFLRPRVTGAEPTGEESRQLLSGLPGARAGRAEAARIAARPENIPLSEDPRALEQLPFDENIKGDLLLNTLTGANRRTALESETPELGITGPANLPIKERALVSASLLFSSSPEERIASIREAVPDVKIVKDSQGNIFADFNNGKGPVVVNKPGISIQDLSVLASDIIQFGLGARAAGVQKAQTATGALLRGAGGATGVSVGREAVSAGTGGQFDIEQPFIEGPLGAAGEAPRAVQQVLRNRQARSLGVEREALADVAPTIERGEFLAEETGIRQFPAQKSLDPFALQEQSFIATLPAASRTASKQLMAQNEDAFRSVKNFINTIAPSENLPGASRRVRTAAENIQMIAKERRQAAAGPIYQDAFSEPGIGELVNLAPVQKFITEESAKVSDSHPVSQVLRAFRRDLQGDIVPEQPAGKLLDATGEPFIPKVPARREPLTLEQFQSVKETIDAKLQKLEGIKPSSATNKARRALVRAEKILLDEMDKASPKFQEARATFASLSPEVDSLKKGIIGKISDVKDDRLKAVAGILFDPAETDPTVLINARDAIQGVDPQAWSDIVRVEAQKRLKNIDLDRTGITPDNAPSKVVRALFGSGQKRDIFLQALPNSEMRQNALFIEEALVRAGQGRPGGSQTAVRGVIEQKLKGVGLAVRRFWKSPVNRLIETGEESAFNASAKSMGELLFNPKHKAKLTSIRTKNLKLPSVTGSLAQVLNDARKSVAEEDRRQKRISKEQN